MPFYKNRGVHHIEFGSGDVIVGRGDIRKNKIGVLCFIPSDAKHRIGEFLPPVKVGTGRDLDRGVHTRFVFTDPKSITVLIQELIKIQSMMLDDNPNGRT